jgi:hypothetical protein
LALSGFRGASQRRPFCRAGSKPISDFFLGPNAGSPAYQTALGKVVVLLKSRELGMVLHKAAAFEIAEAKNAKRLLEHDPNPLSR